MSRPEQPPAAVTRVRSARLVRWARARLPADVLLVIAAGGPVGAGARYAVASALPPRPGAFPWATLAVNVAGSFALGLLLVLFLERFPPSRYLRPFVATGVLGAFTTYSTFAVETDLLVRSGRVATAAAYVVVTIVVGLAAARTGMVVGRMLPLGRKERP